MMKTPTTTKWRHHQQQRNNTKLQYKQNVTLENATIIPPCYIGEDVVLTNATIGPNVSIGKGCKITNAEISNSLIQTHSQVQNAKLDNAMIGNYASFDGNFKSISIGDYSVLE